MARFLQFTLVTLTSVFFIADPLAAVPAAGGLILTCSESPSPPFGSTEA